jgi:DNA-binding transcriptional LysR family regulator
MCEAVLQGIGVAIFLRNSSLIKDNIAEVAVREMSAEQKIYLIATRERIRLKLVAEFVGSAVE